MDKPVDNSLSYNEQKRYDTLYTLRNGASTAQAINLLYEWTKTGLISKREFVRLSEVVFN